MKKYRDKAFSPKANEYNHAAYVEGVKFYRNRRFTKAIKFFEEALEYWPNDPQAWFALGNCYDELKKPSKAEKCFLKSLKYSPSDKKDDVYFNLANSLYDQNMLDEAIEYYCKVTEQSNVYCSAQKNISLAESEKNEGKS
tara:strand:+ start:885 stop:1304 length:420 start_codon:yes stop_codon:yes gene_type:complete